MTELKPKHKPKFCPFCGGKGIEAVLVDAQVYASDDSYPIKSDGSIDETKRVKAKHNSFLFHYRCPACGFGGHLQSVQDMKIKVVPRKKPKKRKK